MSTKSYAYCTNCDGSQTTVNVTSSSGATYVSKNLVQERLLSYTESKDVTFTIPSPVTCQVSPVLKVTTTYYHFGVSADTTISYISSSIQVGDSSVKMTVPVFEYIQQRPWLSVPPPTKVTSGFPAVLADQRFYTYEFVNQQNLPACSQPSNCAVTITGVAATAPSVLGGSNGSLVVTAVGTTGGTVNYTLNNGTPQASATFSGLPAGSYQVKVTNGSCYDIFTAVVPHSTLATGTFDIIHPAQFSASENPIILTVSTPIFDGVAQFSRTEIEIYEGLQDGFQLQFVLNSPINYTTSFYAKNFPNKTNYFLSANLYDGDGNFIRANSLSEMADSLAQVLQQDIIISSNYWINTDANVVTLVAKSASARFDLTPSNVIRYNAAGVATYSGATINLIDGGTDYYQGDLIDGYNIFAELYGSTADIQYGIDLIPSMFNRQTQLTLPYQKSNLMKFNFSDACKAFVFTPKPDYDLTGFTTNNLYMQPFYFRYGEQYPLVQNTNTIFKNYKGSSNYIWVLNSALNYEDPNDMEEYLGQEISGYTKYIKFLTNSPSIKQSSRNQKELLYFILPKDMDAGAITVKGDITFWDGTELTGQTLITISTGSSSNYGGCIIVNVSFDTLGLNAIELSENKIIKQLDLVVTSAVGGDLTLNKTYIYDLEPHANRLGISWLNKLGTFDTFDFYGNNDISASRSSKEYTVSRVVGTDGSIPSGYKYNANYDVLLTPTVKVNSGWINSTTFDWLQELMASNEIYIYSNEFENYVTVKAFKYEKKSTDNTYSIELTLEYTDSVNNISV